MTRRVCSLILSIASLSIFPPPSDGQVTPLTIQELVNASARIVRGQIVDQRSEKFSTRNGNFIVTLITFRVQRTLKGKPRIQLLLEFPGGTVGNETLIIRGMAPFELGDRAVLFLNDPPNQLSPLVGHTQGHFTIEISSSDDVRILNNGRVLTDLDQVGRVADFVVEGVEKPPMTVGQFESEILRIVQSANSMARLIRTEQNGAAGFVTTSNKGARAKYGVGSNVRDDSLHQE